MLCNNWYNGQHMISCYIAVCSYHASMHICADLLQPSLLTCWKYGSGWNYECIWRIRQTIRSLVTLDTSARSFNPLMLNGFSHLYRLDEFISNFKVDGWSFYSNCSRTPCKQTLATLIRRWVLRHLIWVCTICICPIKKDASLIWDKRCLSAYVIIIKMPRAGQHVYQPMSCRSRFPLFFWKHWKSRSAGFSWSHLIRIHTVSHSDCKCNSAN